MVNFLFKPTCRFDVSENFFNSRIRGRIVDFILRRKKFKEDTGSDDDDFAFGIEKLLNENTYDAAYPIHEVSVLRVFV